MQNSKRRRSQGSPGGPAKRPKQGPSSSSNQTVECPFCKEPRPIRNASNPDLENDLVKHFKEECKAVKRNPGILKQTLGGRCTRDIFFPDGAGKPLPSILLEVNVPTILLDVYRESRYALKKISNVPEETTKVHMVAIFYFEGRLELSIQFCMPRVERELKSLQEESSTLKNFRIEGCRALPHGGRRDQHTVEVSFFLTLHKRESLEAQCLRFLGQNNVTQRLTAIASRVHSVVDLHAACTPYEIRIPLQDMLKVLGVVEKIWVEGPSVVVAHHPNHEDIVVPVVKACVRNADIKNLVETDGNSTLLINATNFMKSILGLELAQVVVDFWGYEVISSKNVKQQSSLTLPSLRRTLAEEL